MAAKFGVLIAKQSYRFIDLPRNIYEDLTCFGGWYGAPAFRRHCFGAGRRNDEWWRVGWRLDGWVRRYGRYGGILVPILLVVVVAGLVVWVVKQKRK